MPNKDSRNENYQPTEKGYRPHPVDTFEPEPHSGYQPSNTGDGPTSQPSQPSPPKEE